MERIFFKISGLVTATLMSFSASAVCPDGTQTAGEVFGKPTCILQDRYPNGLNLDAGHNWLLSGGVFIGTNDQVNDPSLKKVELNIQPGTKIYGRTGADFLVIDRGAKIIAKGTANDPIIFTSAKQSNRSRGLWGGIIINGNAPVNGCDTLVCELEGEGSTGFYGGNLSDDSSGILNYVVIEWAGFEITPDNELNGIAFQGVGQGTEVDFIQVHMNSDDGIEFFGGNVNIKHVVLTGIKDDSLDWTAGWKGTAQFVIIKQSDDQANHGIEADNAGSPMDRMPRSAPTLMNMTLIGTSSQTATGGSGILLRKGTGAYIYNSYISGFKSSCIDIDDLETFRNATDGSSENNRKPGIVFQNVYTSCAVGFTPVENDEPWGIQTWFENQVGNSDGVAMDLDGFAPLKPITLQTMASPSQAKLISTDYIGAVKDNNDRWFEGWTTSADN